LPPLPSIKLVSEPLAEELGALSRRLGRLALFRAALAAAYVATDVFFSEARPSRAAAAIFASFVAYSVLLLVFYSHRLARNWSLLVLFLDLIFLLSLVFWGSTELAPALAGVFYVFLVLESWSVHGAREVILIATAVTLVFFSASVESPYTKPLVVTVQSVLFLAVVGGLLAFAVSDQRYSVERRVMALADQGTGASESASVAAIQRGLMELADWFRCSRALLAFWDERNDHFCLCQHPPLEGPNRASSAPQAEDSREWSVFRGERLDFFANQAAAEQEAGGGSAGYDLHPRLIRKFEIYNAVGCGLYGQGRPIGRLLLINRVAPMSARLQRRLKRVAPVFSRLVRQVLVVKSAEYAAYERERYRVAQDFHDGPLQSVISFQMRVHMIRKLMERDPQAAVRELDQLQDLARKQVTEMRTFVNSMRPVEVDTSSLTAAARRLVDDFQKESGVPVTFMTGDEPIGAAGKIGGDILQIIREALHNIQKHAQATHVLFSLEKNGDHLSIAVNDNGKGFRFGGSYTLEELELLRLGPNSIKQRMRALGGDVTLESQPGQGVSLKLKIPLY